MIAPASGVDSGSRRLLLAALLRGLGEPRRSEVTGDLLEDLHDDRRRYGRLRAEMRFVRAAWSLRRAYRRAAARDAHRWRPTGPAMLSRTWTSTLALRALRRSPLFLVTAVLPLSVAVVMLAGVAGFIDALLLRPISAVDPEAVFRVTSTSARDVERFQFSYPEFELIRPFVGPDADLAAVHLTPVLIRSASATEQSLAEIVSGTYFDVLRTTPLAGRALTPGDDDRRAQPATVISDAFWASRFGRSAGALGTTIFLNNVPFVVVGVMRGGGAVTFTAASTDVWVPLHHADALLDRDWATNARQRLLTLIGRTASGQSRQIIAGRLASATVQLATRFPEMRKDDRLIARDGRLLVGSQRRAAAGVAAILGVLAVLAYLLVSVNVAGLFAARWLALRRAVAVRRSLGAPLSAVVAEAMAEGAVVGAIAGGVGGVGYVVLRAQLSAIAILPTLSLRLDLPSGLAVTAWIVGTATATGALLAIGPAWRAARVDIGRVLSEGRGPVAGGRRAAGARRVLVALQVALALILVVSATVLTRGAARLRAADLGIDVDRLAIVDLDVVPPIQAASISTIAREALDAVRALPGVEAAAMSSGAPVDATTPLVDVSAHSSAVIIPRTNVMTVTDGYFDTVGVRVTSGRAFRQADASADVAVVNDALADRLGGDALGQIITLPPDRRLRIIGVASRARYRSVSEGEQPNVYLPAPPGFHLSIVARAATDPRRVLVSMQRALDDVGPGVQGFFPRTGRDHLGFDLLPTDVGSAAARLVGGVALALSALALYGLVAWLVEMRRSEFGLRLAIGATGRDLRRLVLGDALRSVAPGLALGLPAAAAVGILLARLLAGVGGLRAEDLAVAIVAIGVVVIAAAWLPARRAATVDPSMLLRDL